MRYLVGETDWQLRAPGMDVRLVKTAIEQGMADVAEEVRRCVCVFVATLQMTLCGC
jgi:hypothetical protein